MAVLCDSLEAAGALTPAAATPITPVMLWPATLKLLLELGAGAQMGCDWEQSPTGSWAMLSLARVQLWPHNGHPSRVLPIFSPSHLHSVGNLVSVSSLGGWSSDQALPVPRAPRRDQPLHQPWLCHRFHPHPLMPWITAVLLEPIIY